MKFCVFISFAVCAFGAPLLSFLEDEAEGLLDGGPPNAGKLNEGGFDRVNGPFRG